MIGEGNPNLNIQDIIIENLSQSSIKNVIVVPVISRPENYINEKLFSLARIVVPNNKYKGKIEFLSGNMFSYWILTAYWIDSDGEYWKRTRDNKTEKISKLEYDKYYTKIDKTTTTDYVVVYGNENRY